LVWTGGFTPLVGSNVIKVRQTDLAGNVSDNSKVLEFFLDMTAGAAPGVELSADTGVSTIDRITNSGTLLLAGVEDRALVEYSSDGGETWSASFSPVDGTNVIQVRQTDTAGNVSDASGYTFELDTVAPTKPSVTLTVDTGSGANDRITSNPALKVTGGEEKASILFSANSGIDWTDEFVPLLGDNTVLVRQSDTAGNISEVSAPYTFTLDTTSPVIRSLAGQSGAAGEGTIVLTYDGPIDRDALPQASAFNVTTAGVQNPVLNITVADNVVTLTMQDAFKPGAVSVKYSDMTAGDDDQALQDVAGNDAAGFSSGIVADGFVRGATVYIDTNSDGVAEAGVDYLVGITDATGNFFMASDAPVGAIIAVGGVNVDTGVANTMSLKAPEGSSTINPLTTMVQAVLDDQVASGTTVDAASIAAASNTVAVSLGLSDALGGASLTDYDPISSGNIALQKAAAQVATMVTLATGAVSGSSDEGKLLGNLARNILVSSASDTVFDLSDSGVIGAVLSGTAAGSSLAVLSTISDAAAAIASIDNTDGSIAAISSAQGRFLDTVAPLSPSLTGAANTNDASPTLRVTLNTTDSTGGAVVVGDTLTLRDGDVEISSFTLTAADVAAGFKDVSASNLSEGTHHLSATLQDQAGNVGEASASIQVNVDTQAPGLPTVDIIAGDDVINANEQSVAVSGFAEANSTVTLTLGGNTRTVSVDASGAWQYALQSVDIDAMGQGAEVVAVVASDAAGNVSALATRAVTVSTAVPMAVAEIASAVDDVDPVTGNIASGGTTNDQVLGLSGTTSEELAGGEFIVVYDGTTRLGVATMTTATTWSLTTPSLGNGSHTLRAQVENTAGSYGATGTGYTVTVDATLPAQTVTLSAASTYTSVSRPVLSGAVSDLLPDGYVVGIYEGQTRLGDASVVGSSWTFTPTNDLSDGRYSFSAAVISASGVKGASSEVFSLVIDTTAPDTPVIYQVTADDFVNASEQTSVISGRAEASSVLTLTLGSVTHDVQVSAGGTWSHRLTSADILAMGEGVQAISATSRDGVSNVSAAATRTITIDVSTPDMPVFGIVAGDNAISSAELLSGIRIVGLAEAGSRVTLTLSSNNVQSILVGVDGTWGYNLNTAAIKGIGQGSSVLSAVVADVAGNTSAVVTQTITVDTVAPTMSTVTLSTGTDSGALGDNKTNIATPALDFTAEMGVELYLDVGAGFISVGQATGGLQTVATPSLLSDGSFTAKLRAVDAAGNTTERFSKVTLDRVAPSVAITMADSALKVGESSVVTFAFTEPVSGFSNADVAATNGTLSTVASADGGKTWKATFTPTENVEHSINTISVSAAYTDLAGNAGASAVSANYLIDTLVPSATILMSDSVFKSGESAFVTVTFTEAVTDFNVADLTVVNGSLSDLTSRDGGKTWFSTFTPYADVESSVNTISLANTYTDIAGNSGVVGGSENYAIDTMAPSATIEMAASAFKSGESALVTIMFTEVVTGLSVSDLTALNGRLSDLTTSDNGTTWSSTFTPSADVESATNTISLANTYTDLAGNSGRVRVSENYAIDTRAPYATIKMSDRELESGETSSVTITFNEKVFGFNAANLSAVNGSLSDITEKLDSIEWTANFTPLANTLSLSPENLISFSNAGLSDSVGNVSHGKSYSDVYGIFTDAAQASAPRASTTLVHAFDSASAKLLSALPLAIDGEVSGYLSVVTVDDALAGKLDKGSTEAGAGSIYLATSRDGLASRVMPGHVLGAFGKTPKFSEEAASYPSDATYWFDVFSRGSVEGYSEDVPSSSDTEQDDVPVEPTPLELDEKLTRNTTAIDAYTSGLVDTRQEKNAGNVLASTLNRMDVNSRLRETFAERYLSGLSNRGLSIAVKDGNEGVDTSTFGQLMMDSALKDLLRDSKAKGHVLLSCLPTDISNDEDLLLDNSYGLSEGLLDSYVVGSPGEQPCAAGLRTFSQDTFEYWVDALELL